MGGEPALSAAVPPGLARVSGQTTPLTEAEPPWRELSEESPVAILLVRADETVRYANPRATALFGHAAMSDLLGAPWSGLVAAAHRGLIVEVLSGAVVRGRQVWALLPDGETIPVVVNAGLVEDGNQPAVQLALRDLRGTVVANAALDESEFLTRQLLDGSPVGIGLANERPTRRGDHPAGRPSRGGSAPV